MQEPEREALKSADLDLIVQFSHGNVSPDLAACSRLGAWCVRHGGPSEEGVVPVQFWNMCESSSVVLHGPEVVEYKAASTRVLYRCAAITSVLSLALNQNATCWELAHVLLELLSNPEHQSHGASQGLQAQQEEPSLHGSFDNRRMLKFMGSWFVDVMHHELRKRFFREQWSILLQPNTGSPGGEEAGCTVLHPPPDHFYADPFLVDKDGRTYLFLEDYDFTSNKGVISFCEVDAKGQCGQPEVVLEREYHLSYPFLFTWAGEQFMIPETRDNGTIELYRATDFPRSWVQEAVLMSGVAATDATLVEYEGKWWLFTAGLLSYALHNQKLYLFFADSPLGPWQAHPRNPVVSDARHSRPAGNLYMEDGKLIRPGQDCSKGYGYAVALHRVDTLSETEYEETFVASITPDLVRGSKGIHTLNQSTKFHVVDSKFLVPRFAVNRLYPRLEPEPGQCAWFPRTSVAGWR